MTLRLRVLPRFPARISGINGISTYRDGPDLVIESDYGSLVRIPAVDDEATTFFKVWNQDDDSYSIMTFEDVIAAIGVISGFMPLATYDPTNKNQDIFAYAVAQATAQAATRLPLAGGVMTGAIQDLVIAPSSAPTKKAAFDLSQITAGQQRKIWLPDMDVSLGKWEAIQTVTGSGTPPQLIFANLSAFKFLRLSGLVSGSALTTSLQFRVSTNNGSSFDSGSSDYSVQVRTIQNNSQSGASSNTQNAIQIGPSSGIGARAYLDLEIVNLNQATQTQVLMNVGGVDASGAVFKTDSWGQRVSAAAQNAFALFFSAGTFTNWDLLLEGVRG